MTLVIVPPLMVYLAWYIPGVPRYFAEKLTDKIGENYNINIKVDYLYFVPPRSLTFKHILLKEATGDTLISIPKLTVSLSDFSFSDKTISFGRIGIYNGHLDLSQDSSGLNIQYLLDSLSTAKKDTSSTPWQLKIKSFRLKECRFSFNNTLKPDTTLRFNPAHMDLNNLNLVVDSIIQFNENVHLKVNQLSFQDKCGFGISRTKSEFILDNQGIKLLNVWMSTPYSSLEADSISLRYKSLDDFDDFFYKVSIGGGFKQLSLDPFDIHKLTPVAPGLHDRFSMSGVIDGKVSNLKGRDIKVQYGNNTQIEANFDINGLPKLSETFLYLDIVDLQSDMNDIKRLFGKDSLNPLVLPPNFSKFGTIHYKGNFTGFFNDLVAYGAFSTQLGDLSTDMGFKLKEDNSIFYSGNFKSKRFKVGEIIGEADNLNNIAVNLSINGGWSPTGNYLAYLEGNVDSISYNNYKYHRLNVKGLFTQRQFDGEFEVDDPNGYLNFNGRVDFSSGSPTVNFISILKDVKLDKLNIYSPLKNSNLSLKIESNIEGSTLDDIIGQVKITNFVLTNERENIKVPSFVVKSSADGGIKRISCSSNFIDAEMSGVFQFANLASATKQLVNSHISTLFPESSQMNKIVNQEVNVRVNAKKISPFIRVFAPDYTISDSLFINGILNSGKKEVALTVEVDHFSTPKVNVERLNFRLKSNAQKATFNTKAQKVKISNTSTFSNITINNQAYRDTLFTNIFWNNWGEKENSGALFTTTKFNTTDKGELELYTSLLPSEIVFENSKWVLSKSFFSILTNGFVVDGFTASNDKQLMFANGNVLNEGNDELQLRFENFNLSYFTALFDLSMIKFGGELEGNINFYDLLVNPYFTSELTIQDFMFNDTYLGLFNLDSKWNKENSGIELNAMLESNSINALNANGWIYPKDNKMDVDVVLNSLNIGFLDPYLNHILQRIKGSVTGKLKVDGPLDAPGLTGKVNANNIEFDVDLMKTHYTVRDTAVFTPHEMYFDNMTVVDEEGNKGSFRGSIFHTLFWDFAYDLHVRCKDMLVLKTKSNDNPLYYGTIYADGGMDIEGKMNDFLLNIYGKTLPNTKFFIPLQETNEASASRFIRFTTGTPDKKSKSNEYQMQLSGLKMVLNAEITPDALTQIIFNSKSGDILESTGKGNIQVLIDKDGKLSFYGDYTIQDGDYLFTLSNVVNKKFKINEGGTVIWTGDPYDADIDITATYKLRASLSDLYGPSYNDPSVSGGSRRIPIDCNLLLSDKLLRPTIKFDIETPSLENQNKNLIKEYIATEEEMNNQVISLLVLNRFYTPQYLQTADGGSTRSDANNALLTTSTELLTGQLSLWLSQINDNVDVGVSYRPGDEITTEEMALSLSTQVFNNRVTLNGTTGYSKGATTTSSLIGDFDVDVKLNPTGTLSWKAYTKTNDNLIYDNSPTTQGTGITYKEEFNSFDEVIKKYWEMIFGKNDKKNDDDVEE